jgi:hypothetical protein
MEPAAQDAFASCRDLTSWGRVMPGKLDSKRITLASKAACSFYAQAEAAPQLSIVEVPCRRNDTWRRGVGVWNV